MILIDGLFDILMIVSMIDRLFNVYSDCLPSCWCVFHAELICHRVCFLVCQVNMKFDLLVRYLSDATRFTLTKKNILLMS